MDKRLNGIQLAQEILRQVKGLDIVKCELCEETQKIEIHHIDNNPNNNKIANLILLCWSCHKKAHFGKDWGKGNREEKQKGYCKKWRKNNKEKAREYGKKYRKENPKKIRKIKESMKINENKHSN